MQSLRDIETAVHTVASEIPRAHIDDKLDAVYGIIGAQLFETYEDQIRTLLEKLS